MRIRYNLRDPKAKGKTSIILVAHFKGVRYKFGTGISILKSQWRVNDNDGSIIKFKEYTGEEKANRKLKRYGKTLRGFCETIDEKLEEFRNKNGRREPDPEEFRALVKVVIKGEQKKYMGFIECFEDRIRYKEGKISYVPWMSLKRTLSHLQEFVNHREYNHYNLTYESITMRFYEDFLGWMEEERGYSPNTQGNHIRDLKIILRHAYEEGYTQERTYLKEGFIRPSNKSENIYLNLEELDAIEALDLTKNERLEKVRDLFLIGCWSGLRYADYSRIESKHIIGDTIVIETTKTGKTVTIPITETIKKILQRYNYNSPKPISAQKFRDYIKEVGAKIPLLNKPIELNNKVKPKYDFIGGHTARRSFATNMYLPPFDHPAETIMKITGHTSAKIFLDYLKLSDKDAAKILDKKNKEIGR